MEEKIKTFEEKIEQGNAVIQKLNNKDFNIYYFTLDTKGVPSAGIANIYEHVKLLTELGYNAHILHEKNDYKLNSDENGPGLIDWLGEEYSLLSHVSIQEQNINISPADFIVIPDILPTIMDQVKQFPCKKIVLAQSYDLILDLLPLGKRWNIDYGFNDVITTSNKQANYLKNLFPSIGTHVIPVSIPTFFKNSDKPKIPVVTILTRNHGDAIKIAKAFYLQFPVYKWITFKELRGLSRESFANELSKSFLAVWVDDQSSFGTFPLEAMQCETPVIGKIPNLIPEWMETSDAENNYSIKNNGIWTNNTINIPELIATYVKLWLEDSIPDDLTENIKNSNGKYTSEIQKEKITEVYSTLIDKTKDEMNTILSNLNEQYKIALESNK
jgi:glycosyltransferase involved in cell wall biosynthesis